MAAQAFRNLRSELRANPVAEAIFAHGRGTQLRKQYLPMAVLASQRLSDMKF